MSDFCIELSSSVWTQNSVFLKNFKLGQNLTSLELVMVRFASCPVCLVSVNVDCVQETAFIS